jgi:hypothetical protein
MLLVSGATKTTAKISDPRLGSLLRPGNGNRPGSTPWAIDNGAYAGFVEADFLKILGQCSARAAECLWVAAPDVVGDAVATLARFDEWEPRIRAMGFRVALVAQDGLESMAVPWDRFECLFIGGTTEWKLGHGARWLAHQAKRRGKLVHLGRVNSKRRLKYAHTIGADSVDGTAFSRFGDRWIRWGLNAIASNEPQAQFFRRLEENLKP